MENTSKNGPSGPVEPVKLTDKSRFRFACHSGLECFTKCCHGTDIRLTPFDILRLKKKLEIDSDEFLDRYTHFTYDEKSSLPTVSLVKKDKETRACIFLTPEGCSQYEDRPQICRYYPIGLATLKTKMRESADDQGTPSEDHFFFFVHEDHCLGFEEDKEWTVGSWRENQGALEGDDLNRSWMTAFLWRSEPGVKDLDPRQRSLFFLACYDIDGFRRFVFESPFLEKFDVDPERVEKMRHDDEEMLRFALEYMKFFLMIEETVKAKEEVLDEQKK